MKLQDDVELENTKKKLAFLEGRIADRRASHAHLKNDHTLKSYVQMANQLREEIVRYQSAQRRAS